MANVGVILAGGRGERFGLELPKQFAKLAGRQVIEHTVHVFEHHPLIDEIVVVVRPEFTERIWEMARKSGWSKLAKVVSGGEDRFGSTLSAIRALAASHPADTKVLFHDSVRLLVGAQTIDHCLETLDAFDAVDVVIASSDTLVQVDDDGCIARIPPRAQMRRGQTPQAFRLGVIRQAYDKAEAQGRRDFTCDCGVMRAMSPKVSVATVPGSDTNIKITTPLDLFLAEKLMQSRGGGGDRSASLDNLRGRCLVVFGGNSGIGKAIRDMAVVHGAQVHVASRASGVDVADLAQVRTFLDHVASQGQPIDALVNCAGALINKPFTRMTEREIRRLIDTNYLGAVNVAFAAKPHLARSAGVLVNFTSSSYTRGRAYYAVYSSSKCAVANLTQGLAEEWMDEGVRVICINPERTQTPMRTENFGLEDPLTLLSPEVVAHATLAAMLESHTGAIVDVRRDGL